MKRLNLPLAMLLLMLAACQQGQVNRPVPSVAQIGGEIKCATGDKGFSDPEAGWGFCWPSTWKYIERSQGNPAQTRLDLTFDITDVPCVEASPVAGSTPRPICSPSAGLFAFMIISTYERANATDLASWLPANLTGPIPDRQAIQWGNATEAARLSDGRRIALTPHHVVIMDLRSGVGQLDLEAAMSARLDTWKFTF
jgi:hypothetical protein